jgi:homoserine kinase type II
MQTVSRNLARASKMDQIRHLLNCYPLDSQPAHIEPLGSAGGMSGAQFWRITAPRGMLILRRWPTEQPTSDRLRFIHEVIRHAARTLDILPVPINTQDGQSFIHSTGHLWELAPWMPGTADYDSAPSDKKLAAAMTALAHFHNAVSDYQPSAEIAVTLRTGPTAISRRLKRLHELTPNQIHILASAIDDATWPQLASLARNFLAALPNATPRAIAQLEPLAHITLPLQPCLRDIWHDHVLFTRDQVTGLIDFGAVEIDTPATDVARLLGSMTQHDRAAWQTGLNAYAATRPLSPSETLAVFAIDAANPILAGCNWINWIYVDHRRFENRTQVVHRFHQIIRRMKLLP